MNSTTNKCLKIWQQNLNRSLTSQLHLLNTAHPNDWDILILQEPWMGHLGTRSSHHWGVLYPDTYFKDNTKKPQSLIMINTNIPTNAYEQLHFDSPNITGICITQGSSKFLVINIYNDCNHNDSIVAVSLQLSLLFPNDIIPDNTHVIMAGDFNHHHKWWEDPHNSHLTSRKTAIKPLLDLIYRFDFWMMLPPSIPTLQAHSTGNWTRPDNVWCSSHSSELLINCNTNPDLQGPNTDHLPILITLDIPLGHNPLCPSRNFHAIDWDKFVKHLTNLLDNYPTPKHLTTHAEF